MTRSTKLISAFFAFSLVWPPVYFHFLADKARDVILGAGVMRASEIQTLLNAKRWVLEIPEGKDGWNLELACKSGERQYSSGGTTVPGGSTIVLMTRRDTLKDRIEYAWYQTGKTGYAIEDGQLDMQMAMSASGGGSVDDPLANAGVSSWRQGGLVAPGDWLYRGGKKSVKGFPSKEPAEYEVRVQLIPPRELPREVGENDE